MKSKKLNVRCLTLVAFLCLALLPLAAWGDDFADYDSNGKKYDLNLPTVSAGWFVAVDFFPSDTIATIGPYEAEGRPLAANGSTLYLQMNYGVAQWIAVGTVSGTMDFMSPLTAARSLWALATADRCWCSTPPS